MKVTSLWIRRTSKIFWRPRPSCLSQFRRVVVVVALLVLRAELALVPALLDVAEQLDAELVRVEPARLRGHRPGVVVGVVDQLRGLERLLWS